MQGELRSNGQWVPEVHIKAQRGSVVTLFNQSGWVSLSAVRKVTASESDFLEECLPDHCRLESVVVAHSFIETINAEIEETMEKDRWCDVAILAPTDFTSDDVELLLEQCPCYKRLGDWVQITEQCVMHQSFLEVTLLGVKG